MGAQFGKDEQGLFVLLHVGARIVGAQYGSPIRAPYGDMGSAGAHEPIPHAAAPFSADERRPDDPPYSGCVGGVARFLLRPFVVPPRAVLIEEPRASTPWAQLVFNKSTSPS